MVEVQLGNDSKVPQGMLIAFAICTTLLVAVNIEFLQSFIRFCLTKHNSFDRLNFLFVKAVHIGIIPKEPHGRWLGLI